MRTKKQKFYDRMYYTLEFDIYNMFDRVSALKYIRGTKFGPEFRRFYREEVRPYWAKFGLRPGPLWFKYYNKMNGAMDPRYVPNDLHYKYVVPFFDDPMYERQMEDKNLYNLLFPDIRRPETVFKHFAETPYSRGGGDIYCGDDFTPMGREDALALCLGGGRMIIKPTSDTGGGADVKIFSGDGGAEAMGALLDSYAHVDYIVQRAVVQHAELAAFNDSSLNTVRVVTLVFRGEAHVLSAILRIGKPGSGVDNYSSGGYQACVRADGTLEPEAITHSGEFGKDIFVDRTASGKPFAGFRVPQWDEICRTKAMNRDQIFRTLDEFLSGKQAFYQPFFASTGSCAEYPRLFAEVVQDTRCFRRCSGSA